MRPLLRCSRLLLGRNLPSSRHSDALKTRYVAKLGNVARRLCEEFHSCLHDSIRWISDSPNMYLAYSMTTATGLTNINSPYSSGYPSQALLVGDSGCIGQRACLLPVVHQIEGRVDISSSHRTDRLCRPAPFGSCRHSQSLHPYRPPAVVLIMINERLEQASIFSRSRCVVMWRDFVTVSQDRRIGTG